MKVFSKVLGKVFVFGVWQFICMTDKSNFRYTGLLIEITSLFDVFVPSFKISDLRILVAFHISWKTKKDVL